MRKAVILAMSAPLVVGPATAALAAGTSVPVPTVGATAVHQVVAPAAAGDATTQTTTPAPASDSEGKALDVAGVVSVGHTSAHAGPDGTSATGNSIELGGKPLADGKTGGTASGGKSTSGSLVDTGSTPLGQVQVAPFSAATTASTADARAALAHAHLGGGSVPGFIDLLVLDSQSHADYSSSQSTAKSSSDGAVLNVDDQLTITLLHSEASSAKGGDLSYLIGVNGTDVGTSDQTAGQCQIPIPQLVTINCLSATGGAGAGALNAAQVIAANFVPDQLPDVTVVGASGRAPASAVTSNAQPPTGASSVEGARQTAAAPTATGGSLPFTGLDAMAFAGMGAAVVATGAAGMILGRRRRTTA